MRTLGSGLTLSNRNGDEYKVSCLLYADDAVLMAESECEISRLGRVFNEVCKRRLLKINAGKSKVMVVERNGHSVPEVTIDGTVLEVVDKFTYLGALLDKRGLGEAEVSSRVKKGRKVVGCVGELKRKYKMRGDALRSIHEGVLVPTLTYGCETLVWNAEARSKVRAVEMSNLRNICGVRRIDKIRNQEVLRRCGVKKGILAKMEESTLRWYGHVVRMESERLVKKIYDGIFEGSRRRGRPKKKWVDYVNECVGRREPGLSKEDVAAVANNREAWRRLANVGAINV